MNRLKKIQRQINLAIFLYQFTYGSLRFITHVSEFITQFVTMFFYIAYINIHVLLWFFYAIFYTLPAYICLGIFGISTKITFNYNKNKQHVETK